MKNIIITLLGAIVLQPVFAQSPTGNDPSMQNQTNPNQTTTTQSTTQTSDMWDLYGGNRVETSRVPENYSKAFTTKYPNQSNVTWYSYKEGYIATYPGSDKMYQGVIYDKNGNMMGTVNRVKSSTLSSSVSANMKKKYPDYKGDYVYVITNPSGTKRYVSNVNGTWTDWDESGNYMEK